MCTCGRMRAAAERVAPPVTGIKLIDIIIMNGHGRLTPHVQCHVHVHDIVIWIESDLSTYTYSCH